MYSFFFYESNDVKLTNNILYGNQQTVNAITTVTIIFIIYIKTSKNK